MSGSSPKALKETDDAFGECTPLGACPNQHCRLDFLDDLLQIILIRTPFFLAPSEVLFNLLPDLLAQGLLDQAILVDQPEPG